MLDIPSKHIVPVGHDTESLTYAGYACTNELERGDSAFRRLSLLITGDKPRVRPSTGVMELVEMEFEHSTEYPAEGVFFQNFKVKDRGHPLELFPELPCDGVAPTWAIIYLVWQQPHIAPVGPLSRYEPNVFEIDEDLFFIEGSDEHGWSLYLGSESDGAALYQGTRLFIPIDSF